METFKEIISELVIFTERGFKGFGIVFSIYGTGAFLAAIIINFLTKVHLDHDSKDPADEDDISRKNKDMRMVLIICGAAFYAGAVLSFIMMRAYKGKTGITADEVKRRKEFQMIQKHGDPSGYHYQNLGFDQPQMT